MGLQEYIARTPHADVDDAFEHWGQAIFTSLPACNASAYNTLVEIAGTRLDSIQDSAEMFEGEDVSVYFPERIRFPDGTPLVTDEMNGVIASMRLYDQLQDYLLEGFGKAYREAIASDDSFLYIQIRPRSIINYGTHPAPDQ